MLGKYPLDRPSVIPFIVIITAVLSSTAVLPCALGQSVGTLNGRYRGGRPGARRMRAMAAAATAYAARS